MAARAQRSPPKDKRRRRRQMTVLILGYVVIVFALAWYFDSQATTTILLVRHADTSPAPGESDPGLNANGLARAERLAQFISDIDVDASVDAIYASEFRRTQQTAAPLARRLGIEVGIADQADIEGFMAQVLDDHKGEIVLIVSHSNLIPELVAELHGHQSIPEIAENDYDNFFVVTIPWFGKVKTLQLHYTGQIIGSKLSSG